MSEASQPVQNKSMVTMNPNCTMDASLSIQALWPGDHDRATHPFSPDSCWLGAVGTLHGSRIHKPSAADQMAAHRQSFRLAILREMNRSAETGFADSFDQLDQGGSFEGSARATHKNDQARERGVSDQRQKVISVARHQDVVVVIRISEHLFIAGGRRQDFAQADDVVIHRFQRIGCIFGDIMVEEKNHASVCI
jgi:hypothetical protein